MGTTPTFVGLPSPEGAGKKNDGIFLTVATTQVYRENNESNPPVDPTVSVSYAASIAPLGTASLTCPAVAAGKVGFLAKIELHSTGLCLWTIAAGATVLGYRVTNGGSAEYYPPHRFYAQCASGSSFTATAENISQVNCGAGATAFWDQF